jgi:hypothetical protein
MRAGSGLLAVYSWNVLSTGIDFGCFVKWNWFLGVHHHEAPTIGLGSIGVRMGPDSFITRHLDYTPALGNGTSPFRRRTMTCEEAKSAKRFPFLSVLETMWITHPEEAQIELTESFRHGATITRMVDQDAYSLRMQQTALFPDEENNVFPQSIRIEDKRYAFHYNIFVTQLPPNIRLVEKNVTCPSLRTSPRYELEDEELHMRTAYGRFSKTPYEKPFKITGQLMKTLPYISSTTNATVLGYNISGYVERSTLALPLEVIWLSETNFATNREELCSCDFVSTCESYTGKCALDVMEEHRFPILQYANDEDEQNVQTHDMSFPSHSIIVNTTSSSEYATGLGLICALYVIVCIQPVCIIFFLNFKMRRLRQVSSQGK